jgi:hypothetical protein
LTPLAFVSVEFFSTSTWTQILQSWRSGQYFLWNFGRLRLKCDGTRAETRFRLSAKRTSLFKSAEVTVQSTTGSRGVCIWGNNIGYTKFRGNMKGTGYPLYLPVSSSLLRPCVTVCHHVSTGLYLSATLHKFISKEPLVLISKCWREC